MRIFEGKIIVLAAPTNFSINQMIAQELGALGFTVFEIVPPSFRYKSIWQRLHNLGRKLFFNDYENKKRLRREAIDAYYQNAVEQAGEYDFALFIRPDMFPTFFFDKLRERGKPIIGYQWDGMHRYPNISDYLKYFDRFFVFDPADVTTAQRPLTNFCAVNTSRKINDVTMKSGLVFFIGSFDAFRFGQALRLKSLLQEGSYDCQFIFSTGHERDIEAIKSAGFIHIKGYMKVLDAMEFVKRAEVLIDIVVPDHKGLSFRVFESLMFCKKLITTNTDVEKYDFYHPNNIFIYDGGNDDKLVAFLKAPMVSIPQNIKLKYGFENWIKYVLDYGEYQPITLPVE